MPLWASQTTYTEIPSDLKIFTGQKRNLFENSLFSVLLKMHIPISYEKIVIDLKFVFLSGNIKYERQRTVKNANSEEAS